MALLKIQNAKSIFRGKTIINFTGNPLWNPSQLTSAVWFDAADATTITLNGSNVSQWNDKSGNNRNATQGTAAAQP